MKDKVAILIKKDPPTVQPTDVIKAVASLSTSDQARFFALHEGSRPYSSQAFRIYKANAFGSKGESRLFLKISLINHSCVPNAEISDSNKDDDDTDHVFAIKHIATGEEIFINYIGQSETMIRGHRQTVARIYYGFLCSCTACRLPGQEQQLSDRRRQLIAVLSNALEGFQPPIARYFDGLARLTPEQAEDPRVLNGIPRFPLSSALTLQQKTAYHALLGHLLVAENFAGFKVATAFSNAAETLVHQMDQLVESHMLVYPTSTRLATLWMGKALQIMDSARGQASEEYKYIAQTWEFMKESNPMIAGMLYASKVTRGKEGSYALRVIERGGGAVEMKELTEAEAKGVVRGQK